MFRYFCDLLVTFNIFHPQPESEMQTAADCSLVTSHGNVKLITLRILLASVSVPKLRYLCFSGFWFSHATAICYL